MSENRMIGTAGGSLELQAQAVADLAEELLGRASAVTASAAAKASQMANLGKLVTPDVSVGYLNAAYLDWKATAPVAGASLLEQAFMAGSSAARVAAALSAFTAPQEYVVLPRRLTAANGAKSALTCEFHETVEHTCPCAHSEEVDSDEPCEMCGDSGTVLDKVTVGWDTLKNIHAAVVQLFGTEVPVAAEDHKRGIVVSQAEFAAFQVWKQGGCPAITFEEIVEYDPLPALEGLIQAVNPYLESGAGPADPNASWARPLALACDGATQVLSAGGTRKAFSTPNPAAHAALERLNAAITGHLRAVSIDPLHSSIIAEARERLISAQADALRVVASQAVGGTPTVNEVPVAETPSAHSPLFSDFVRAVDAQVRDWRQAAAEGRVVSASEELRETYRATERLFAVDIDSLVADSANPLELRAHQVLFTAVSEFSRDARSALGPVQEALDVARSVLVEPQAPTQPVVTAGEPARDLLPLLSQLFHAVSGYELACEESPAGVEYALGQLREAQAAANEALTDSCRVTPGPVTDALAELLRAAVVSLSGTADASALERLGEAQAKAFDVLSSCAPAPASMVGFGGGAV